jgi:AcrR family transcriptional regulator
MAEQKKQHPADLLVTAFDLIAEQGWRRLSLIAVARRAGVRPIEVYRELPGRGAVLRALSRRIDEAMLELDEADLAGLPPRDRVFELMMRRFEALVPFRPGLRRLARDARRDPCVLALTVCRLERSLAWLQDAAGLRRSGLRARLARRALAAAYLQTMRVWFKDEAADLGKTMAELDKQLRRIQPFAGLREPRAGRAPQGEAPEPA